MYILDTSPLLFSPKVVDTNTKTFRLEIDRDVFVGHPIHIREEDKKKASEAAGVKEKPKRDPSPPKKESGAAKPAAKDAKAGGKKGGGGDAAAVAKVVEMALVKQVRECEAVEAALRKEVAQLRKELEEVEES